MDKKEKLPVKGQFFYFVKEENAYKEEIEVEEQRFRGVEYGFPITTFPLQYKNIRKCTSKIQAA